MPVRDIVVIGASAGGVAALQALLASLPRDFGAAVFIVQHIGASGRSHLPEILGRAGPLPVAHPRDGEPIVPGRIRIAPPDLHMVLAPPGARGTNGRVRLLHGPKENYTRPAVDPLFRSAGLAFGRRVIGVILTGHLDDGAAGLLAIKDLGGVAVVQHPADCVAPSMPESALAQVAVDHCVPLARIGPLLTDIVLNDPPPLDTLAPAVRQPAPFRLVETEHAITTRGSTMIEASQWKELGTISDITCPECQGILRELQDHRVLRFRCEAAGHAWSARSLLGRLAATREGAVASALRASVEEAALARRLSLRTAEQGGEHDAVFLAVQTEQAEHRSARLRELLPAPPKGSGLDAILGDTAAEPEARRSP